MKGPSTLALGILALIGALLLTWAAVPVGAWWFHQRGQLDQEIAWLEGMARVLPLGGSLDSRIDALYRERITQELRAGRVDKAVQALRAGRRRALRSGAPYDPELVALGLETYTRCADRVLQHGRRSLAADWQDSSFVLAIRDPDEHNRSAALGALLDGLDLRVADGQPCAALARVTWARRGLGGDIPGFDPAIEPRLELLCQQSRQPGARR